MAMLFHDDEYIACPACGTPAATVEKVYRFVPDSKEPGAVNGEYLYTQIRCSECGAILKTFKQVESVRLDR